MPEPTNYLDSLPDLDLGSGDTDLLVQEQEAEPVYLPAGEIDPRIKLLSYSSRNTLNKCPRKFQLYRLSAIQAEGDAEKDMLQQLTFDYGTIVGDGIQAVLCHKPLDRVIIDMLLGWSVDFLDRNPKQKKSFWEAMLAVQKFQSLAEGGYLEEYELMYFTDSEGNEKPAIELSFNINLPDGYSYRGFIDAVLRHKLTGAVVVLELKTTSFRQVSTALYKNSSQALGYSVVLDTLFPNLASYTVLYLVYTTPTREYAELPFEKSAQQKALWLTSLLLDTKKIELYETYGVYTQEGQCCYDFFRDCEYLGLCGMSTERLTKPLTQGILDGIADRESGYDFTFEFADLIQAQQDMMGES